MPTYRDKARGRFIFEFDRQINGQRIRARKLLPKTWSQAQADTFERQESARLYAIATRVDKPEHSIEYAVKLYLQERVPQLKSGQNIINELAQMFWVYKDKPIAALAEVCKVYTAKATREDGSPLAPATIRNRIRYLTSACRYAWKHHAVIDRDPADRVIAPQVKNERRYFIDRATMLRLARQCRHRPTRAAIRIAFYSGMRLGEILRARRLDHMFVLEDTKNGLPRHVPIHPKIAPCARMALPNPSWIAKHFRQARQALGMDWLHFHDLRHSAASQMINQGVDLYTVGAVLGHQSAASTKRYAHLATDALRNAIGMIGQKNPHRSK